MHTLYTYSLKELSPTNKVRCIYSLKGRNKDKGAIINNNGKFLVDGCFIIPSKNEKEIDTILSYWKVNYKKTKIKLIN